MNVRAVLVCLVLSATMWLAGCGHYVCHETFGNSTCSSQGGGGITNTAATYLLISDAGGIIGEVFDASAGTIKLNSNFGTVKVPSNVPGDWMAVVQQKFMYTGYTSLGEIYGWSVAADGTLSAISGSPFQAAFLSGTTGGSQGMIANPAGTLLFALDSVNEQVNVYQIGASGALTLASGSPVTLPTGFKPFNLAIDGQGHFLYISNRVGTVTTEIVGYGISSSGTLTSMGNPVPSTVQQMQGESSGKFMIGTSGGVISDTNLYVESIDQSTGALTQTSVSLTGTPQSVAVQPNSGGDLVYAFDNPTNNSASGAIEGFTLNLSSGALTAIPNMTATGDSGEFDQSGSYFFVVTSATNVGNTLDAFKVSANTLATPVATVGWNAGAWQPFDAP